MRKRLRISSLAGFACGLLVAVAGGSARSDSLLLKLSTHINGTTPGDATPWVTADFESTTAGTVTLTITNTMQSAEYLHDFLFNTLSTVNPSNLTITQTGGAATPTTIHQGENGYNGGSQTQAGLFDVEMTWSANVFAGQDTAIFKITGTNITAATFDAFSTVSSGTAYLAAADVRNIQPGGASGSIGTQTAVVPEPTSGVLGLIGLAGVSSFRWYRRRKSS